MLKTNVNLRTNLSPYLDLIMTKKFHFFQIIKSA